MTNKSKTTVKPFLTIANGIKAVEFQSVAFGGIETKRFEMPQNKISSVIEIDKAEFYARDEELHNGNLSPDEKYSNPVRIILTTKKI